MDKDQKELDYEKRKRERDERRKKLEQEINQTNTVLTSPPSSPSSSPTSKEGHSASSISQPSELLSPPKISVEVKEPIEWPPTEQTSLKLQNEITSHKETKDKLNKFTQDSKIEIDRLQKIVRDLEFEKKHLTEININNAETTKIKTGFVNEEIEELKKMIKQLKEEKERLLLEKECLEEDIKDWQWREEQYTKRIQELKDEIDIMLDEQLEVFNQAEEKWRKRESELKAQIERQKGKRQILKEQFNNEIEKMRYENELTIDRYQKEVENLKKELRELKKENFETIPNHSSSQTDTRARSGSVSWERNLSMKKTEKKTNPPTSKDLITRSQSERRINLKAERSLFVQQMKAKLQKESEEEVTDEKIVTEEQKIIETNSTTVVPTEIKTYQLESNEQGKETVVLQESQEEKEIGENQEDEEENQDEGEEDSESESDLPLEEQLKIERRRTEDARAKLEQLVNHFAEYKQYLENEKEELEEKLNSESELIEKLKQDIKELEEENESIREQYDELADEFDEKMKEHEQEKKIAVKENLENLQTLMKELTYIESLNQELSQQLDKQQDMIEKERQEMEEREKISQEIISELEKKLKNQTAVVDVSVEETLKGIKDDSEKISKLKALLSNERKRMENIHFHLSQIREIVKPYEKDDESKLLSKLREETEAHSKTIEQLKEEKKKSDENKKKVEQEITKNKDLKKQNDSLKQRLFHLHETLSKMNSGNRKTTEFKNFLADIEETSKINEEAPENPTSNKILGRKTTELTTEEKVSAMFFYISKGKYSDLKNLLQRTKGLLNKVNPDGKTPLQLCSLLGELHCMRVLLENKADPNVQDENGQTALHYAANCKKEPIEVIKLLLKKEETLVEIQNSKGDLPLHLMVANKYIDTKTLSMIITKGTNIINYQNQNSETPLHIAVKEGRTDLIQFLIDHGAEVNIPNFEEETALHHAARGGFIEIVKTLLDAGANPNVKGIHGTPSEVTDNISIKEVIERYAKMRSALERVGISIPSSTEEFIKEVTGVKVSTQHKRPVTFNPLKRWEQNKRNSGTLEVGEPCLPEDEVIKPNPLHGKKIPTHNPLFDPVQQKEYFRKSLSNFSPENSLSSFETLSSPNNNLNLTFSLPSAPVLPALNSQIDKATLEKRKSNDLTKRRSMTLFARTSSFENNSSSKSPTSPETNKKPKTKNDDGAILIGEPQFVGKGPTLEELTDNLNREGGTEALQTRGQTSPSTVATLRPKKKVSKERSALFSSLKREKKTQEKKN